MAGAGRGRGRGKALGVLNFKKIKVLHGNSGAVVRRRQEEDDERYARELQKKLDRENGNPARGKKVEIEDPSISE